MPKKTSGPTTANARRTRKVASYTLSDNARLAVAVLAEMHGITLSAAVEAAVLEKLEKHERAARG